MHLHPDDPNRPSSVDWYLARVTLRYNHDNCPDHEIYPVGKVTQANLVAATHEDNGSFCRHDSGKKVAATTHEGFFLEIGSEETRKGAPRADWKTYAVWRPQASGLVNIEYWIFYPYNDGFSIFNHESDWEHVRVTVDPKGNGGQGQATEVKLSAHKGGTIVKVDRSEAEVGRHPSRCVRREGHARELPRAGHVRHRRDAGHREGQHEGRRGRRRLEDRERRREHRDAREAQERPGLPEVLGPLGRDQRRPRNERHHAPFPVGSRNGSSEPPRCARTLRDRTASFGLQQRLSRGRDCTHERRNQPGRRDDRGLGGAGHRRRRGGGARPDVRGGWRPLRSNHLRHVRQVHRCPRRRQRRGQGVPGSCVERCVPSVGPRSRLHRVDRDDEQRAARPLRPPWPLRPPRRAGRGAGVD